MSDLYIRFTISLFVFIGVVLPAFSQPTSISLRQAWVTDTVFRTPESTLYHKEKDLVYVTNMNAIHDDEKDGDGFISILNPNGTIASLNWITGLNDPKGMAISKGKLYVGDLTQLVEIDIAKGKITQRYDAEGALMLNDVAMLPNGDVFATDTRKNRVYMLRNGKLTLWLDSASLNRPNGLFADGNTLLLASMGSGSVVKLDLDTKKTKRWITSTPSADGIASDGKGNFFISNWYGEVYVVSNKSEVTKILDTKDQKSNTADIDYSSAHNLLFVPTFFKNRIVAYTVVYK